MLNRSVGAVLFSMYMALSVAAQQGGSCKNMQYQNHNPIDYGPLKVATLRGTVADPQQFPVPQACLGVFTEKEHKLIATAESDEKGRCAFPHVPPGDYRLIAACDAFCAANARLRVVKRAKKNIQVRVHMKPAAIDVCSYIELAQKE